MCINFHLTDVCNNINNLLNQVHQFFNELIQKVSGIFARATEKQEPVVQSTEPLNASKVDPSSHLFETIKEIQTLSETHKICLFVGRTAEESLPEPQEGEIWISMDMFSTQKDASRNFSRGFNLTPPDPERLHLPLSFNDPSQLKPIHKLFDKVVLDQSTLKFFKAGGVTPWVILGSLLKDSPTSELTAEATTGSFVFQRNMNSENAAEYKAKALKKEADDLNASLKGLFHEVTYHQNTPFPYPTAYNQNGETTSFFTVRHPKIDQKTLKWNEYILQKENEPP